MRFLSFALGGLLLSTVRPALAQTSAATPATPRYYVGLSAYTSYYQQIGNRRTGTTGFAVPLQLTAGYQLSPRVASPRVESLRVELRGARLHCGSRS